MCVEEGGVARLIENVNTVVATDLYGIKRTSNHHLTDVKLTFVYFVFSASVEWS